MQSVGHIRRIAFFTVFVAVLFAVMPSCQPPGTGDGNLKLLLTAGFSDPGKAILPEGATPVADVDVLHLYVTIASVGLIAADGVVPVFTGPVEIDLVGLTEVSNLIDEVAAPPGVYTGVRVAVSSATLIHSAAPRFVQNLAISNGGVFNIDLDLEVLAASDGLLHIDWGGFGAFALDATSYAFIPVPTASLRTSAPSVRVEGVIADVDPIAQSLILAGESAMYLVDFATADIFLPEDMLEATGTPDNLALQARAAVYATAGLTGNLTADRIELLGNGEDAGLVDLCHIHQGLPPNAFTISVPRAAAQDHLDHGDFMGPCDGGDPFTFTYLAGPGGSLTGTSTQIVVPGSDTSAVTAVPDTGYFFVKWSDGSTQNPRIDTSTNTDITVTAEFVRRFNLTYAAGAGGTLTGNTAQLVDIGKNGAAVTAVPNSGFAFVNWSDGSTQNPRTDANVMAHINVTATFIQRFTLAYAAGANGALTGATAQTVDKGASGSPVDAVPNIGFAFSAWSDGSTQDPRTDANVMANVNVTATFVTRQYILTYTAGEGGTITGNPLQSIPAGADGSEVRARANQGFTFVEWSDGSTVNPRRDFDVMDDITVTASFIPVYTVRYSAGANGALQGTSPQTIAQGGASTPVTIVPNVGYAFVQWSDGRTDNPRSDTNVQAGISVSATYKRQYTLTYLAGTGGAISGAALQVVNAAENGSPVTAVPSEGFVFFQWSDGNTSNPRTDTNVNANITVTAEFLDHFTLTYTAGVNGAIDGTSPQAVSPGADGAPVTAVPNTGYIFSGWSDGNTDNPRTDTNVMANVNVTANFASMPFTLLYTAGPGGVITGTAEQTVQTGGNGSQVRAKPDSGFAFKMWSDGSTVNPRTDTNVTANIDVTAIFVPLYTVRYISGPNGTLLGASPQSIPEGGNSTPVTIVPNPGYAFVKWSDERTDNPRMDTNITAPLSVDAIYKRQFTLTYTAGENGSITGDSPQIVDQGADGTAVTAVPDENFAFLRWSDGVFQNPRTDLNLQADVNAIAIFVDHFTLTYLADPNGSIAGETQQSVLPGADGAPVTAVPNDGHIFLQWSDGSTQNPRTDTGLSTNIIVTAQFVGKPEMIPVAESTFTMGSADFGDDLQHGMDDELPRHEVTLSAYEISKFEVTNQQLCDFLNDYYERGLLRRAAGAPWSGQIEGIYAGATPKRIVAYNLKECNVTFSNGKIIPKTKIGLPGATVYSMGNHPATNITWFGAVLYANWLSEAEGLTPVYEEVLWSANLANDGYHLPTEAQWERAAAWDGTKHWIYSLTADSMNDMSANVRRDRANFEVVTDDFINPIGLVQDGISPYTSPVGWFNGLNISPNGNLQTVDSKSPIGAYDMSGNVIEWCHDRYSATYYSASPALNPDGPPSGISNAARGGAWGRTRNARNVRAAVRFNFAPDFTDGIIGFRIARGGGLEGDVGE